MSGLGVRFPALVCLFVFLGGQSSANVLKYIPSNVDTAKGLIQNLPFLANHYCTYLKYDVVFIIDDSGSIPSGQFKKGLDGLKLLTESSAGDTKFSAIKYSDAARLLFKFVSPHQAKLKLTNVQKDDGLTNTQAALKMAREDLFLNPSSSGHRPGAGRVVVVLTDGNSNIQSDQTVHQANLLKVIGTEVFVIAVGHYGPLGLQEMKDIASYPYEKRFFRVREFKKFQDVAQMVLASVQHG